MVLNKRKCGRCKTTKDKTSFGTLLGQKYSQNYCKQCMREYNQEARDKRALRIKNTSWF